MHQPRYCIGYKSSTLEAFYTRNGKWVLGLRWADAETFLNREQAEAKIARLKADYSVDEYLKPLLKVCGYGFEIND